MKNKQQEEMVARVGEDPAVSGTAPTATAKPIPPTAIPTAPAGTTTPVALTIAPPTATSPERTDSMKIRITLEDTVLMATLVGSQTTRDLISLLPLTLLPGNEIRGLDDFERGNSETVDWLEQASGD